MGKTDKKLYKTAREGGVRKRVARLIADAAAETGGKGDGKAPKALRKTAKDLRGIVETIEDRASKPTKRKAGARKAARTRQRNAAKRSAAAKKAVKTRARA